MSSELTTALDDFESELTSTESRVSSDVAAKNAEIARLQALVNAGSATPQEIARLADFKQRLVNIDPSVPSPAP